MNTLKLSKLIHTWLIDIDGTLVFHNGHKKNGDMLLSGIKEFWSSIPENDVIILLSARTSDEQEETLNFLVSHGLRFNHAIFNLPTGERILINDIKPKGLNTAIAVNIHRNIGLSNFEINFTND